MNTKPGIVGRKLGCTQFFTADGSIQRVTVIQAGPLTVLDKRTKEKDGYSALVLGFEDKKEKHTTKALIGHFKKVNSTPKRIVKELRAEADFVAKFEPGQIIKLDEVFEAGQSVDAQGKTRGRGFTGVMRRWNFKGSATSSHGTHEYFRHGGSIGTNMTPGRTLPNLKMPGQYGNETVSILNLTVARVDAEQNLLHLEGAIPGPKGGLVTVRHAVKKRLKKGS